VNKRARKRLIIATAVIVVVLTVGIVYLVSKQGAYYRQVSDLTTQNLDGKNVKVGGKVLPGFTHDASGFHFVMEDLTGKTATVKVNYSGQMPETFGAGVDVVVTGGFSAASDTINATDLQTKCPSKYKAQESSAPLPASPSP
jgi:cytochrome c-type biogenesis protein CcmE